MSWGKLKDIKGAHFEQIFGLCAKYICIHVVAVVFERIKGARTLTQFGCGRHFNNV